MTPGILFALLGLYLTSLYSFLLFHTLAEFFQRSRCIFLIHYLMERQTAPSRQLSGYAGGRLSLRWRY